MYGGNVIQIVGNVIYKVWGNVFLFLYWIDGEGVVRFWFGYMLEKYHMEQGYSWL